MAIKRFTDEEIQIANNSSIIDYINTLGIQTKRAGQTLKVEGYGGLYIDPVRNKWNCFSQGKGGGIIQLVMFLENKTWVQAMKGILNKSYTNEIKPITKTKTQDIENKKLNLPKKNNTYNHVIAYLIKTRKIDKEVIYKFIQNKTLYEDERKNCVFVGYDEKDIPRYAGIRGTNTNIPFKGEVGGSNKAYSFKLKGETNKLYVFESPIEIMSYLTLQKNKGFNIEKGKHHMLSLGCLAPVALEKYLKDNPNIEEIILCLNNDKWGIKASNEIKDIYKDKFNIRTEYPTLGDWNEDLVYKINIDNSLQVEENNSNIEYFEDDCEMEM